MPMHPPPILMPGDGCFLGHGLHIGEAELESLRAYLLAHSPQNRTDEEDVDQTSEAGSTSDSMNPNSPNLNSLRPTNTTGPVALARPMSCDEHLYEMDSVGMGQGTFKRRRKIGWSSTEDLAILATVRLLGTQWPRIAAQFPGRTSDAVRNRWHRLQKTHSLGDTDEGRAALDALLLACGFEQDWPLSPDLGGRSPDLLCIKGADHGRAMWTQHEDTLIEEGVRRYGLKWRQIAASLPGRSDSSVRNRWMRLQKDVQMDARYGTFSPSSPSKSSRSDSPLKPLKAVPVSGQVMHMLNNAPPTAGVIGVLAADLKRNPPPVRNNSATMLAAIPLPPAPVGGLPAVRHASSGGLQSSRPPPTAPATLKRRYPVAEETIIAKGARARTPLVGFDLMSFVEAVSGVIDTSYAVALPSARIPASAADFDNEPLVFAIDEMASVELYARSERASDRTSGVELSPPRATPVKHSFRPPQALCNVAVLLRGLAALSIGVSILCRVR